MNSLLQRSISQNEKLKLKLQNVVHVSPLINGKNCRHHSNMSYYIRLIEGRLWSIAPLNSFIVYCFFFLFLKALQELKKM